MQRREFCKLIATASGAAMLPSCSRRAARGDSNAQRVYLVAFDGLDPRIVRQMMDAGRLPNFAKLAASGSFSPIRTSTPAHTPVAFSNIISGADPGLHQVFDFIHRDVHTGDSKLAVRPYFSTADSIAPENDWALSMGSWRLPLSGGQTALLRRGPAFWDYLIEAGVDATIYYVPANYPTPAPEGRGAFRAISGMGTPDLLGGYGEFTLFTPDAPRNGRQVDGGRFAFLSMLGNRGHAELVGPDNYLREPDANGRLPRMAVGIDVVRDPSERVAKIVLSGTTVLLKEGEWSDWVPVVFETGLPGSWAVGAVGAPTAIAGAVRLFMKQVHPRLELYVSPVNIDPAAPLAPISTPAEFATELAARHGRFYTTGIPEDTKALSHGALEEAQFLSQTQLVLEERMAQFREALESFEAGCLFFYFGDTDLVQHMFWRDRDQEHPGRDAKQGDEFAAVIDELYVKADGLVGELLARVRPQDTVLVFSDHGFTTFRRGFNLNSWLAESGFMKRGTAAPGLAAAEMFADVDWAGTRAYGLGLNGLYLNTKNREQFGIVTDQERASVLAELRDKLLAIADDDGRRVIERVDLVEDLYPNADPMIAPDVFVGYSDGFRASWATVLGGMPADLLEDNLDRWSGDHSIASNLVPGMLLSNRKLAVENPSISDIAPTVLAAYGIEKPSQMTGRPLFDPTV